MMFSPDFNQSLLKIIDIPKQRLINSLVRDTPNIVKRTKARVVGDHKFKEIKCINVLCLFQRIFRLLCLLQVF